MTLAADTTPLLDNRCIRRKGSFTEVEKFCLRALLLDNQGKNVDSTQGHHHMKQKNVLPSQSTSIRDEIDDAILFQVPFSTPETRSNNKFARHEKKILGLWQAHEDGIHPVIMNRRRSASCLNSGRYQSSRSSFMTNSIGTQDNPQEAGGCDDDSAHMSRKSSASALTARTDVEVRIPHEHDESSSWGEDDGGFVHYDAWEVLNDEYAEDFGFDFKETVQSISATLMDEYDDDSRPHVFKILGTSADDESAQPHVLSPPLMDSLLNFVPDCISMENWWMKFSLIRDGASLYTLKQYVKAAPYTLLAIETTKGEVFGAFTSNTWKNHSTFYGNSPAFLWRMRHNRRTPCHSLFEQAQMESEIDVYAFSGLNDLIQVCEDHRLAIGGGKLASDWDEGLGDSKREPLTLEGVDVNSLEAGKNYGFGIALDEYLLEGTTSPCGTFRNPCLINNLSKGEIFRVANLEMWTFTPCMDFKSAERMEMTRFFVEESVRSAATSATSSSNDVYSNPFSSQEEFQNDFYRRVGHNEPASRHQRKSSFEYKYLVAPSMTAGHR